VLSRYGAINSYRKTHQHGENEASPKPGRAEQATERAMLGRVRAHARKEAGNEGELQAETEVIGVPCQKQSLICHAVPPRA
jgi:hypothetical protein